MEDTGGSGQSPEHLEELLGYLACPIDGSPLTALRDAGGQVVALRSRNGKYPVINNVPCLIPDLSRDGDRDLQLWQERQDRMWQEYQAGDEDVFSEDDEVTRYVGEIIAQVGQGLYLDVGCGALPSLPYMRAAGDHVRWIGIDPFFGDAVRDFPFAQALGEYLPFRGQVFDGVLYGSTIYHQKDPRQSLVRTRRVIKPHGKLFVWYEPARRDARYLAWTIRLALGWPCNYSPSLRWAFTVQSLRSLLQQTGWSVEEEVLLCVRCPSYATCRHPEAYLVIASAAEPDRDQELSAATHG